jgi:AraC-like DNA-binding protein
MGEVRAIGPDERSGVLHPENLERYGARWFEPEATIGGVVDRYWHVRWQLNRGQSITQRIITLPAVTLSIEDGDVPAPLVVTGVHRRAWMREIAGSGSVLGIRLRPAGLAVVSDLAPERVADVTVPVAPGLDAKLHSLLSEIAAETSPESRIRVANEAIRALLAERPIESELLLANAVLDELTSRIRSRTGSALADHLGVSERAIQRALKRTLGHGPKWVSRWIRLQEVARTLANGTHPDFATLAVDLGYADQAHLLNDFRNAVGVTPGAYLRSLHALSAS